MLAFAGLWDRWRSPLTGIDVLSCAIVVSGASEWMTPYQDSTPVLLTPDQFCPWLNGTMVTAISGRRPSRRCANGW